MSQMALLPSKGKYKFVLGYQHHVVPSHIRRSGTVDTHSFLRFTVLTKSSYVFPSYTLMLPVRVALGLPLSLFPSINPSNCIQTPLSVYKPLLVYTNPSLDRLKQL